jgi:PAS domain S-box-containing protein
MADDQEEEQLRSVALRNAQSILLARRRAEEALLKQSEWLRITLASIGDAVISTDEEGKVTFMNGVAESLTGWPQADALGRPLVDVFHIINEQSREPVDNPVEKVLREGMVVGLANHTVLIARNGLERLIDDSAAPIRDDQEKIIGVVLVFHDITRQRQAELARSHLAAIVESSADAIVSKNLQGIIRSWNKGAEKVFGYTASETVGQPITMLIPIQYIDEEPTILEKIRRGETVDHYETVRRRKDGELINISLTVSPIRDEAGTIIGASKIARDITNRKRAEVEREQLLAREQEARLQAESANRMKDEFLATVSHELRTPLNAILGWSRILSGGNLDSETSMRGLNSIEKNAKAQAQLIEDLLDISRIISGKFRLRAQPLEVASVIESAIDTVRPTAEAKGIRLQVVLDPEAGPVLGDAGRLQQVVWNLLSNALKFTPKGGRVQVRLIRINSHIELEVSDTGQGITREFLPHIFERFRQADSTISRAHRGLGLGLAIVRHIVELHGGIVAAASPGKDQGATFTIRLPLIVTHMKAADEARAHPKVDTDVALHFQPSLILEGVRVLIVDDEPESLFLLSTVLTQSGAYIKTAASAVEGFKEVKEWRPDVIVSDIGMPGEDGYAFIKRVKNWTHENGLRIPAVALTAYARAEDRMRALASGYQLHIPKPVEPAELITVVESVIERHTTPPRTSN